MANAILSVKATERSTYVINASFFDENGVAVIPVSIKWSLSTPGGAIINSRSGVVILVPAVSVDVVLSGLDLAFLSGEQREARRIFTVECTYNSVLGLGLPLNASAYFVIKDLTIIT